MIREESAVTVEEISFGYERRKIFSGLSIDIGKGDFCTILGPNGSGKTTLMKCISGLLVPNEGQITLFGKPLAEYSIREKARRVAYVPQSQSFVFDISVFEYVMMGRNPYQKPWETGTKADREVVEETLRCCNILKYRDTSLQSLSGGELQRAMVARAIAQDTDIILLDEPLSNIDITHKFEIMDILRAMNASRGVTVITILHDLTIASHYSKQILFMKEGEILAYGDKDAVFDERNVRKCFDLGSRYAVEKSGFVYLSE
ncbi:MAG: ABC transporter ATP-binding protein [Bacteroidales bacterium]|nr:ABC transporter ATP-binding protein [Bacteroidales bacterium]